MFTATDLLWCTTKKSIWAYPAEFTMLLSQRVEAGEAGLLHNNEHRLTFVKPSPGTTIRSRPPDEIASSLSSSSEQILWF